MDARVAPGELQRLAECAQEPIRAPGAVQPHGALLVVDPDTNAITHASDNTARILGVDAVALLGRPLGDLLDESTLSAIENVLDADSDAGNPVLTTVGSRQFDVIVHRIDERLLIEFEPFEATPPEMLLAIRGALRRLARVRSVAELWAKTAIEVRAITGFDQVMVYHFHPDDHGEVVAEAVVPEMEPYLGLHYPASDIPAQARALYVTKLSRQILRGAEPSSEVLADANQREARELDLSSAELRAVSPHHLEFMRNMGQATTFSLSLLLNDTLVGMITCAHRTARRLPFNVRDGLEILANQVSLQLGSMREIERLSQRNEVQEVRAALVAQLVRSDDLIQALLHQHVTLLDLIPADGVAVRVSDQGDHLGKVPADSVLERFGEILTATGLDADVATDSLGTDHPRLAEWLPGVAGLVVRRLGTNGDYIAWFRGELTRTVRWLGDVSPSNRLTPLSPRKSFSAWSEDVTGTSEPWRGLEREAREFARDVQASLLQRVQSQLADLALRDPLTGLPNRRLFMDRLHGQLSQARSADPLALLFIDLDRFKSINDEFGHVAGDAALTHVARAVLNVTRSSDTVARLGGDEFVVLCDSSPDDALHLAKRILDAISEAPEGSPAWRVSASVGVAMAWGSAQASQLLSAADAAMYRAKAEGRGRVSV